MPSIQDFISQYLPYYLPEPLSREELVNRGNELFDPYFDERIGEGRSDADLQRSRFLEDLQDSRGTLDTGRGRAREDLQTALARLSQNRSRGLRDFGTEEGLLSRQRGQLNRGQDLSRRAQQEQLAFQGIAGRGTIGDIQRNELQNNQQQAQKSLADAFGNLGTRRSRFIEDYDTNQGDLNRNFSRYQQDYNTQSSGLDRRQERGVFDLDQNLSRFVRGQNRSRASAIEQYASNPAYQFPYY